MAYNNQQAPFWDYIRSFDQQGAGVDHAQSANFFGPPPHHPGPHSHHQGAHPHHGPGAFGFGEPWGQRGFGEGRNWEGPEGHGRHGPRHGGRKGRHGHRDGEKEGEASGTPNGSVDVEGVEVEKTDGEAGPSGGEGRRRGPRGFGKRGHCHGHRRGSPDAEGVEGEKTDGEASQSGGEGRRRGPRGFGKRGRCHSHGRGCSDVEGAEGEKTDGEAGPSGGEDRRRGPRGFGKRGHCQHKCSDVEGEQTGGEAGQSGGDSRRGPHGFGKKGRHGHHGQAYGFEHGREGRGGMGGWGHGPRGHPFGGFHMRGPRGVSGGMGAFDLSGLFDTINSHPMGQQPWAQMLRQYAQQAGLAGGAARSGETLVPEDTDAENTFVPPIDVFSTETAYILHIALPGCKKEDVGVNWDADKGVLNVAGVVYRHGDEEFLKTLSQSERKVGVFEREVKLPPGNEEKEEVDGDSITAKLEDGVLVVTVAKMEKEENWTEVKRIDVL